MKSNTRRATLVCAWCGIGIAGLGVLQAQTQPTRPKNPLPSPRQPAPPERTQPNQPNQTPPPADPNQPVDPNLQQPANGSMYSGPFMFQSPQSQTAFNTRTQDLLRMEDQFEARRTELLRRLGEARAMTGDRKLDALADVLQRVILDQQQMQQYLIEARTTWSGEATLDAQGMTDQRDKNNNPNPRNNPSEIPPNNRR